MKTKYNGTQTEKNLEAAFAGESQARNKYTYFALHASVFKRKERFCVCFGRYDAEQDARTKCNELKANGINTHVVKGE